MEIPSFQWPFGLFGSGNSTETADKSVESAESKGDSHEAVLPPVVGGNVGPEAPPAPKRPAVIA